MIYKNLFKIKTNLPVKYNRLIKFATSLCVLLFLFYSGIKLNLLTAVSVVVFLYIFQGYIENKILLKDLNDKEAAQEELIRTICNFRR